MASGARTQTFRDARSAMAIGALMNARGLMELILLNIGLEAGLISGKLYTILALNSSSRNVRGAAAIGVSEIESQCAHTSTTPGPPRSGLGPHSTLRCAGPPSSAKG